VSFVSVPASITYTEHNFTLCEGGVGGDGGEGVRDTGGQGGMGEAVDFGWTDPLLLRGANAVDVPDLPVVGFCENYKLSDKIFKLLEAEGYEMAGALLEASESSLAMAGLKSGQIAELKRALKQLLAAGKSDQISVCERRIEISRRVIGP
jgi:hypothetical protein